MDEPRNNEFDKWSYSGKFIEIIESYKFFPHFTAPPNRMLQKAQETEHININCVDPLGRSALLMAIDNENLEMVELLINHRVDTKDALLHAISEEFVEAVEVLLDHEDSFHKVGEPHVSILFLSILYHLFSILSFPLLFFLSLLIFSLVSFNSLLLLSSFFIFFYLLLLLPSPFCPLPFPLSFYIIFFTFPYLFLIPPSISPIVKITLAKPFRKSLNLLKALINTKKSIFFLCFFKSWEALPHDTATFTPGKESN